MTVGTSGNYQQFDSPEFLGPSTPTATVDGCVTTQMAVQGLHCAACSWLIERALTNQTGMQSARVKLSDHTLSLIYDPNQLQLSGIAKLLDRLGYQLLPLDGTRQNHLRSENRRLLIKIAIAAFLAANAMWIAVALYAGQFSGVAAEHKYFFELMGMFLGAAAVLGPGRTFLTGAVAAVRTRTPHMDLPIGLALGIGTLVGLWNAVNGVGHVYFDGLSMLVFLLLVGRWMQFRQQHQAAKSVDLMLRITPKHAHLIQADGGTVPVLVERLKEGDSIQIAAGDGLPADGMVVSGTSRLNRSLLTGESWPVSVQPGDWVEAGTINVGSPLVVQVAATGKSSRIGKVMQAVELAAAQKTPLVQLADRIGGYFVVLVMLLSLLTFFLWLPESMDDAVNFATAMLIVACPCALALATPLAIAVGIGRAARAQILVRDGCVLQRLAKPGKLWLDKTGTLTEGRQHAKWVWGNLPALQLAAAVERQCQHPIARAIVTAAETYDQEPEREADRVQVVTGGVMGSVDQHQVLIGNEACLTAHGIYLDDSQHDFAAQLIQAGESPILVAVDGMVAGLIGICDPIRQQATEFIQQARSLGWSIGMLSGDHQQIAMRVGQQIGLAPEDCHGGVTPEGKLATIERSLGRYATVAMVGDGANDAAALAAADVGIAVRGGAEVSLLAAPVFMASNRLMNLVLLLQGCRKTTRIIYTNFAVSLTYNLIAVALTLTGWISPLLAAIIMPVSSATVLGLTFAIPSFSTNVSDEYALRGKSL
jgi:Cu2+-exporting ATPase